MTDTTEQRIERVARAICEASSGDHSCVCLRDSRSPLAMTTAPKCVKAVKQARAADAISYRAGFEAALDRSVIELLEANYREVERRRNAETEIEWLKKEIHALCPDHEAGTGESGCRNGMVYGPDGKTMGACEWRGHAVGGHT